jgi:hypothetical protein
MEQLQQLAERENRMFCARLQDLRARHADDVGLLKQRHRQELQQLEHDFKQQVTRRQVSSRVTFTLARCSGAAAGERA